MKQIFSNEHALLIWVKIALSRSEFYQDLKRGHSMELFLMCKIPYIPTAQRLETEKARRS